MYHYGTNNFAVRQLDLGLPSRLGSKLLLTGYSAKWVLCVQLLSLTIHAFEENNGVAIAS